MILALIPVNLELIFTLGFVIGTRSWETPKGVPNHNKTGPGDSLIVFFILAVHKVVL